MNPTVPRYEFRAFGQSLEAAADAIRHSGPCEGSRESLETYIVAKGSHDYNVKVRDGRLDIKQLIARHADLELWKPVLSESFPVTAKLVADTLYPTLGLTARQLDSLKPRSNYTLPELIDQVVWPDDRLVAASVYKHRCQFQLGPCRVETDEVLVNGAAIQSVAVEAEDHELVRHTVEDLGLGNFENVSYLRAVQRIVGLEPLPDPAWNRSAPSTGPSSGPMGATCPK